MVSQLSLYFETLKWFLFSYKRFNRRWKEKREKDQNVFFNYFYYIFSLLGNLDFSMAKASKRSSLYKVSKATRKKVEL